jgi:beta-lactamase class D
MNFKKSNFLLISVFTVIACSPINTVKENLTVPDESKMIIREDFKTYFDNCGVDGSVAIYDHNKKQWIVSDTVGIKVETLPASTFKIINLLIALETNTIQDENEVVQWVGHTDTVKYGFRPEIYHDMPVREAFEESAGWVFVELAKKIGKDRYRDYLTRCRYGNNDLSQTDTDFWNFGNFAISPKNQVEFLRGLYEETLPFSKRNMAIVKKVMITEQTDAYTIRAKTGWTRDNNINTGWWTGYIETKNGTYLFATRLLQDRKQNRADFGPCRKEITKKVFKDLNIIR